jgi:protein O-GlcNAc transferase
MGKTILVSYAGASDTDLNSSLLRAQTIMTASAPTGKIDEVIAWSRPKLQETRFYDQNRNLLDRPRGSGYWLWKPYIILEALRSAHENDVVVYWDVGKFRPNQFTRSVTPLIRWCQMHGGLLPGVPILPQCRWTKRDCFHYMGCDTDRFWKVSQIQATFSFWSGRVAFEFVSEWLHWCTHRRCLTDDPNECGLPNLPGFKEHRHDQSILTNLCVKKRVAVPFPPPVLPGYWTKNMNLWADLLESRHLPVPKVERAPNHPTRTERACRIILKYEPENPFALRCLGKAYLRSQRASDAVEVLKQAVALIPDQRDFQRDLILALNAAGKHDESLSIMGRIVLETRLDVQSRVALAQTLQAAGNLREAVTEYEEAIKLDPKNVQALNDLGLVFSDLHNPVMAEQCFIAASVLEPNAPKIHANWGNVLSKQGKIEQAIDCYRRALELKPDSPGIHSNLLLAYNYQTRSDENLLAEHKEWAERHAAKFYPKESVCPAKRTSGRLRIGYVSADFRRHSVACFIKPIIRTHNRDRFEVFCYSDVQRPDDITRTIRGLVDQWRVIYGRSDDEVARIILNDKIDILVDLAGHMGRHRLLVFARRVAPVQVSYLGYPNTTGLATMDYRITDAEADPPGITESHYTEKLMRLPTGFLCYEPPSVTPEVRSKRVADASPVVFGCFNNFAKVTPEMIGVWAEILRSVPKSRLLLKAEGLADPKTQADLRTAFAQHQVEGSRVELVGFLPSLAEHLAAYQRVDIALDTFPYHGTTTTCEALWMGVPLVTMAGSSHRSRVGVSILTRLGLLELVATGFREYIAAAVGLVTDAPRRWQIASGLRGQMMRSQLMNEADFIDSLEAAYQQAWRCS